MYNSTLGYILSDIIMACETRLDRITKLARSILAAVLFVNDYSTAKSETTTWPAFRAPVPTKSVRLTHA
jgi:hypothetical protein